MKERPSKGLTLVEVGRRKCEGIEQGLPCLQAADRTLNKASSRSLSIKSLCEHL
jgi:hypothetical protein